MGVRGGIWGGKGVPSCLSLGAGCGQDQPRPPGLHQAHPLPLCGRQWACFRGHRAEWQFFSLQLDRHLLSK